MPTHAASSQSLPASRARPSSRQLLAGATSDERARWRLGASAAAHRLTAASGCLSLPGVDDGRDFQTTRHAMRSVGLGGDDQEQLFGILSALLHLMDADFDPCPKDDDGCVIGAAGAESLAAAAQLLRCAAAALTKALTTRTRVTPDGPIVSPLGAKAAAENRDALAKVRALCLLRVFVCLDVFVCAYVSSCVCVKVCVRMGYSRE